MPNLNDLDGPAFANPILRKAVAGVLADTILPDALAHNDLAELITGLLDAPTFGQSSLAEVFSAANVGLDDAWDLAGLVYEAVLNAAVDL